MSESCVHRWVIDAPDGRELLTGRCSGCGAERQFRATLSDDEEMLVSLGLTLPRLSLLQKDLTLDRVRQAKEATRARHAATPVSDVLVQRMRRVLRRHGPLTPDEIAELAPCSAARAERAARERSEFRLRDDGLVELADA